MENVTINFNGDVHIHFNLNDLDDFFEDDEFDEDFDDEGCDEEDDFDEDGDTEQSNLKISVFGLPENIDREAVQVVLETACHILDGLIDKSASSREGDSHEGV